MTQRQRNTLGFTVLDAAWMEVRYAVRSLRRSPGFTIVAMLTLGLGIGANTALFSVVYGVLLRPLDYRDADRLVAFKVERQYEGRPTPVPANFSLPDLQMWQAMGRSFESVAMFANEAGLLTSDSGSEVISVATVTPSFFATIGGRLLLGRGLGPADDGLPAVVISQRQWQQRLGGDPQAIGRHIVLNRQSYVVVGVADRSFQIPSADIDVWRPVGFARTLNPQLGGARAGGFQVLARLRDEATPTEAQAETAALCRALDPQLRARVIPIRDWFLTGSIRPTLAVLVAAVALLLLVACANVANLMLARSAARSRETAIRLALGTSRARLVLQTAVHSGLIAAGGSAAGALLATALVGGFLILKPAGIPRLDAVRIDVPVLLFAVLLAALTTAIVGVLPAMQSADVAAALKGGGPTTTSSRRVRRMRSALIVAELAVSVLLLVGASLLGRSLVRLLQTDVGVRTEHVTAALVDVSFGQTIRMSEERRLVDTIVERVRALPGVTTAGAGASLPPNRARLRFTMQRFDDAPGQPANYMVDAVTATPEFFSTLGVRLQQGRWFTAADDNAHPDVMIVSAATARQLFADRDPVGRSLTLPLLREGGKGSGPVTLVGIVDEVKYTGLDAPANAVIYRPFAQQPWSSMFIIARTPAAAPGLASLMRREISSVDPAIGILSVDTLDELIADAASQPRFRAFTLSAVSFLAVLLAGVGLYGVVAYTVAQRTAEFGVRMALGAGPGDVIVLVLRDGLWMGGAGVAIGMLLAAALSRLAAGFLYGVQPSDSVSFLSAGVTLFAVALLASYIPARRASRIDPLVALRCD